MSEPSYYSQGRISPLEFIRANGYDFARGCILKYIHRCFEKGGKEDLNKAKDYIEEILNHYEEYKDHYLKSPDKHHS